MPRSAAARALRERDFVLLLGGNWVSQLGTQMQRVAITYHLFLLTHSPFSLGFLGLFRAAPIALFSLSGGVVADARDRRRVMLTTQVLLMMISVALTAITLLRVASPPLLYGLSFVAGAVFAFDAPARQSLTPMIVPPEALQGALSLNVTGWQIAAVAGPALAGLMLGSERHLAWIYGIDVASFLAILVALLFIRPRRAALPVARPGWESAKEGLRFIRTQPVILWMLAADFFGTFFAGAMQLMPFFALKLGVGGPGLGLLYAAPSIGAGLAAGGMALIPEIDRRGAVLLACIALYGLCIIGFGLSPVFWLAVVFLAGSGAADSVSTVLRQTARQMLTPDEMRGRMTSLTMIFFVGGPQLGEVEAGLVAGWFGPVASVVSGGVLCVLMIGAVATLAPALRRYRTGPP